MSPRCPRRILFVSHAFLPDSHAGVELYTARLAGGLVDLGHRAAVVTARLRVGAAQNSVEQQEVGNLPVFGIVQNYPYRDLPEAIEDPSIDRVFDQLLSEFQPDLVSVQTLAHLSAGIPSRAAARGVPVVLHLHDGWLSCPSGGQRLHPDSSLCLPVDPRRCGACFDRYRHREGPLERAGRWLAAQLPEAVAPDAIHRVFQGLPTPARDALKRLNELAARRQAGGSPPAEDREQLDPRIEARRGAVPKTLEHVTSILSPTRFLLESLEADGLVLPHASVVPTGVPLPRTQATTRSTGPLRVLYLGTWVPHKGPQVLARAVASLAGVVEARAVGPTPFPAFRQEVEEAAAGRLRCEGPVPPEGVAELLDWCDVVVVPSLWAENAPLVVLEARAHAKPVLASRLGGLPELIEEGVDGHLFPPGDSAALAALLSEPSRLRELAQAVRPPRSTEDFVAAVEAHYEGLLA